MKFRHAIAATAFAALVAAPMASAHISAKATSLEAGSYSYVTFSVGHGCEGSPTTMIELQVPDGVTSFTPERSPFWDAKVTMKKPAEKMTSAHGEEITEVPDTVTWTAKTPLPDKQLDVLGASIKLPESEGQLDFPIVQTCEKGSTEWTEVASEGEEEPEHPAPNLQLTAGTGDAHGGGGDAKAEGDESATAGDVAEHDEAMDDIQEDVDTARTWAIVGIAIGALGLLFGLIGMRRRKG